MKTKQDNKQAPQDSRSPWTRPSLRRLATSEAELNPSGAHADSEGFIS
jgi:hypothetical protein